MLPLVVDLSPWFSIAALVLLGFSTQEFGNLLSGYPCDTYGTFAASATAPMAFLRAILSGLFPLFGRQLFECLGASYSTFILATVATLFCVIAVLFGKYGKQVRTSSPFAARMLESSSIEKLEGHFLTAREQLTSV